MLWARQVGLGPGVPESHFGEALEALTGQRFGTDWHAWVEWYGATDLEPPPGFARWKGELLAQVDPRFGEFFGGDAPLRLRPEEIQWGGVRVDGIPALDRPRALPAAQATYLEPDEPVFGIALNGEARAYPLRIMDWHEMANDVVGGVPVSLAYCTLCGAAVAFHGRASDGRVYTFGSSGLLYRSNKLMYDRQTRSLWNQLSGEPVTGALAATEPRLTLLPVVLATWRAWRERHPGTSVLDLATGYDRPYVPGQPYRDYFASERTMFPVWRRNALLPAKSRVYALRIGGVPKAYPLEPLLRERVVNDALAGTEVVLVAFGGEVRVDAHGERGGSLSYAAGAEVRAYAREGRRFRSAPDPDALQDEAGDTWRIGEEALTASDGRTLPRLPGHLAYWFGWFAFFPQTLVYGQP
jgi:hypothetical protein